MKSGEQYFDEARLELGFNRRLEPIDPNYGFTYSGKSIDHDFYNLALENAWAFSNLSKRIRSECFPSLHLSDNAQRFEKICQQFETNRI